MDFLIDWESIPWNEPEGEAQPGYRDKTCVRDGQTVRLIEITEGYAPKEWCAERHLFHVVAGEATMRFRDGDRAIRFRAGDTGIILGGEANAHNVEPAAGESIRVLLFEQD
jgi:hypothetical protein